MGRSRETLEEQKQLIRLVLRSSVDADLVSTADDDRAIVLPGRRESLGVQRSPRQEAEYAAVVHRLVDDQHPHVRWQLPAALRQLPYRDREMLRLRVAWQYRSKLVREALGLGLRYPVVPRCEELLRELALLLWADDGLPLVVGRENGRAP